MVRGDIWRLILFWPAHLTYEVLAADGEPIMAGASIYVAYFGLDWLG